MPSLILLLLLQAALCLGINQGEGFEKKAGRPPPSSRIKHMNEVFATPGFHPGYVPELLTPALGPKHRSENVSKTGTFFDYEWVNHTFEAHTPAGDANVTYSGVLLNTTVSMSAYAPVWKRTRFTCEAVNTSTGEPLDAASALLAVPTRGADDGAIAMPTLRLRLKMGSSVAGMDLAKDVLYLLSLNGSSVVLDDVFLASTPDFGAGTACGNLTTYERPFYKTFLPSQGGMQVYLVPSTMQEAFAFLSGNATFTPDFDVLQGKEAPAGAADASGNTSARRAQYLFTRNLADFRMNMDSNYKIIRPSIPFSDQIGGIKSSCENCGFGFALTFTLSFDSCLFLNPSLSFGLDFGSWGGKWTIGSVNFGNIQVFGDVASCRRISAWAASAEGGGADLGSGGGPQGLAPLTCSHMAGISLMGFSASICGNAGFLFKAELKGTARASAGLKIESPAVTLTLPHSGGSTTNTDFYSTSTPIFPVQDAGDMTFTIAGFTVPITLAFELTAFTGLSSTLPLAAGVMLPSVTIPAFQSTTNAAYGADLTLGATIGYYYRDTSGNTISPKLVGTNQISMSKAFNPPTWLPQGTIDYNAPSLSVPTLVSPLQFRIVLGAVATLKVWTNGRIYGEVYMGTTARATPPAQSSACTASPGGQLDLSYFVNLVVGTGAITAEMAFGSTVTAVASSFGVPGWAASLVSSNILSRINIFPALQFVYRVINAPACGTGSGCTMCLGGGGVSTFTAADTTVPSWAINAMPSPQPSRMPLPVAPSVSSTPTPPPAAGVGGSSGSAACTLTGTTSATVGVRIALSDPLSIVLSPLSYEAARTALVSAVALAASVPSAAVKLLELSESAMGVSNSDWAALAARPWSSSTASSSAAVEATYVFPPRAVLGNGAAPWLKVGLTDVFLSVVGLPVSSCTTDPAAALQATLQTYYWAHYIGQVLLNAALPGVYGLGSSYSAPGNLMVLPIPASSPRPASCTGSLDLPVPAATGLDIRALPAGFAGNTWGVPVAVLNSAQCSRTAGTKLACANSPVMIGSVQYMYINNLASLNMEAN